MTPEQLDALAAAVAVTVAPALVTAVHRDDARLVEKLLTGLDRQRLYALAVVLADQVPDREARPRRQSQAAARMEDYAFMRSTGASVAEAAARLGIRERHALRAYEPHYRVVAACDDATNTDEGIAA